MLTSKGFVYDMDIFDFHTFDVDTATTVYKLFAKQNAEIKKWLIENRATVTYKQYEEKAQGLLVTCASEELFNTIRGEHQYVSPLKP